MPVTAPSTTAIPASISKSFPINSIIFLLCIKKCALQAKHTSKCTSLVVTQILHTRKNRKYKVRFILPHVKKYEFV